MYMEILIYNGGVTAQKKTMDTPAKLISNSHIYFIIN